MCIPCHLKRGLDVGGSVGIRRGLQGLETAAFHVMDTGHRVVETRSKCARKGHDWRNPDVTQPGQDTKGTHLNCRHCNKTVERTDETIQLGTLTMNIQVRVGKPGWKKSRSGRRSQHSRKGRRQAA